MKSIKGYGLVVVLGLIAGALFGVIGGCGPGDDDDDATGDDDGGECDVDPICSAFRNAGSEGGFVNVTASSGATTATVASNGLADHPMGPFGTNPNTVQEQDYSFSIPLEPQQGNDTATPLGAMGIAWDGVPFFNPSDAQDYGGCTGNAGVIETENDGVDTYGAHPQQEGQYHYHTGGFLEFAGELGLSHSPDAHSSLLGYSFDGYPIYGPFGYDDPTDASSGVRLLAPCYKTKEARDCCGDETACGTDVFIGQVEARLGAFLEDWEFDADAYAAGACDLNEYNMRYQVTPEYPEGTLAYVMAFDGDLDPTFPYIIGLTYYGVPAENDAGGNGGPPPG